MTALDIAGLLKEYGGWGVASIFALVIYKLYTDLGACNSRAISDRDMVLKAMHGATTAAEKMNGLIEGITKTLRSHEDTSDDLAKQVELFTQESRHAIANVQTSLNAIVNRMDREREAVRGRS
ncbi:hypothetical protein [Methylobacterium oryzisoli]|uniref:hypothetical protein n=1 Tax=Methylobacterium oryzisoli TaxID=3385502 RepID=UPI003891A2A7